MYMCIRVCVCACTVNIYRNCGAHVGRSGGPWKDGRTINDDYDEDDDDDDDVVVPPHALESYSVFRT